MARNQVIASLPTSVRCLMELSTRNGWSLIKLCKYVLKAAATFTPGAFGNYG